MLDRYFAVLAEAVQRHGGIVEKFIGDAVMAVFGIPVLHEDDGLRAVRAAAEIPGAVRELNGELERRWGVQLRVRVGLSTGEVIAGAAAGAGEQRLATGDAVNLAARLQGLAGPGEVVLGESTVRLVRTAGRVDPLDPVVVKGKAVLVRPYRLVAVDPHPAGPLGASPLVGRSDELENLRRAWSETLSRGGRNGAS